MTNLIKAPSSVNYNASVVLNGKLHKDGRFKAGIVNYDRRVSERLTFVSIS